MAKRVTSTITRNPKTTSCFDVVFGCALGLDIIGQALAAAKEELEDVRAQFEKAKAEGLAQAHEEAKSISSKLP